MKIEQCIVGREVVAVAHPVVQGNSLGFVLKYRDEMGPDDVLYVDPADVVVEQQSNDNADAVVVNTKGKKAKGEGEQA